MKTITTSNLSKIAINKSGISMINYDESADCISRQAVINLVKGMSNANPSYWCKVDVVDREYLLDELEEMSSVTPKQKTGHWEMFEDEDGIYGVCDICGVDADFTHYGEAYPYCPNCGAKMEEEDDRG